MTTKSEVDIIVKLSQESEEKSWKRLKKIRKKVLTKREVSDIINLTDVQEKNKSETTQKVVKNGLRNTKSCGQQQDLEN